MSWTNDKPLNLRQAIALKLVVIAIKIVAPYEYNHQFEKDWKELEDIITGKTEEPKAAKK